MQIQKKICVASSYANKLHAFTSEWLCGNALPLHGSWALSALMWRTSSRMLDTLLARISCAHTRNDMEMCECVQIQSSCERSSMRIQSQGMEKVIFNREIWIFLPKGQMPALVWKHVRMCVNVCAKRRTHAEPENACWPRCRRRWIIQIRVKCMQTSGRRLLCIRTHQHASFEYTHLCLADTCSVRLQIKANALFFSKITENG